MHYLIIWLSFFTAYCIEYRHYTNIIAYDTLMQMTIYHNIRRFSLNMYGSLLGRDAIFPMKVAEGCYLKVRGCGSELRGSETSQTRGI